MHDMQTDHSSHTALGEPAGHDAPVGHGTDHTGQEQNFRSRFLGSLLLSTPVLVFSPTLQTWPGLSIPTFTGSGWIPSPTGGAFLMSIRPSIVAINAQLLRRTALST